MEEVGAALGETQRFECQVIGYPTPSIRWFKDEVDITNNERYHVDYERDLGVITLVIRNVTLTDEGLYQCRAENSEGYATTTAYLVVKGPPYSILTRIRSLVIGLLKCEYWMRIRIENSSLFETFPGNFLDIN